MMISLQPPWDELQSMRGKDLVFVKNKTWHGK